MQQGASRCRQEQAASYAMTARHLCQRQGSPDLCQLVVDEVKVRLGSFQSEITMNVDCRLQQCSRDSVVHQDKSLLMAEVRRWVLQSQARYTGGRWSTRLVEW